MSIYIDASAFVRWEKGVFDLPSWLEANGGDELARIPATVWQELHYGVFDWNPSRANKRAFYLSLIKAVVEAPRWPSPSWRGTWPTPGRTRARSG